MKPWRDEPALLIEDKTKPVTESLVGEADTALRMAAAAEMLGLNWQIQGYRCPTSDENVTVPEYRVVVWNTLMSQTATWVPQSEADR
jgi:hypothetical protein